MGTKPANSQSEIKSLTVVLRSHTEDTVGLRIHDFLSNDQLTVDFMHLLTQLFDYRRSSKVESNLHENEGIIRAISFTGEFKIPSREGENLGVGF